MYKNNLEKGTHRFVYKVFIYIYIYTYNVWMIRITMMLKKKNKFTVGRQPLQNVGPTIIAIWDRE